MKIIDNINDRAITEIARLRKRDYRQETGLTIAEGYPEIKRAFKSGIKVRTLYICPEILPDIDKEFDKDVIVHVTKDVFKKMSFGHRQKGIIAVCKPHHYSLNTLKLSKNPLIVVLEGVEKPGNLGAVVRTADGAGVDAVIMCDSKTDVYNHNTVRSSTGTIFMMQAASASKEEVLDFLTKKKIRIFFASAKTEKIYTDCDLSKSCAIIIGNEHSGVSDFWSEHADGSLKIPMHGEAKSLNAAVSSSILIYEARRQRK